MRDEDGVAFLRWALPRMHLRWPGFRPVRRQVIRRIDRRLRELGLADVTAYRVHLEAHADEWGHLDGLCRVTISRFGRDWPIWDAIAGQVLPARAAEAIATGRDHLTAWSAGCGAGEEPYTLAMAWQALSPRWPGLGCAILGTDLDEHQLARAREGVYPVAPLRELPAAWRAAGVIEDGAVARVQPVVQAMVRLDARDVRGEPPPGPFDLILCRNLAFNYFDEETQRGIAEAMRGAMRPGGFLIVGVHERLPAGAEGWEVFGPSIYRAA